MPLRDINRSIYDPKSHIERDRRTSSPFNPEQNEKIVISTPPQDIYALTEEEARRSAALRKKWIIGGIIGVAVICAIAVVAISAIKYSRSAFSSDKVSVVVEGPDRIGGTAEAVFLMRVRNDNRIPITNAELRVSFPKTFAPIENPQFNQRGAEVGDFSLGTVSAYSERTVEFRGRFKGTREENASIRVTLNYTPEKLAGSFQVSNQKTVQASSSSLLIDITSPIEAATGDEIEYLIQYRNTGSQPLYSLRMKLDYPGLFHPTGSTPLASEGQNVWYIPGLDPGQSGTIRVRGILEGVKNEEANFKAMLGVVQGDNTFTMFSESTSKTKIVASPLQVVMTANDLKNSKANVGDLIHYRLSYQNQGDVALRDVIIVQTLEGNAFNFAKADIRRGSLNTSKKTITWRAADIPDLALLKPSQSGVIEFDIPLLSVLTVDSANDKNFSADSSVTIDSNDVPDRLGGKRIIGKDKTRIAINSQLVSRLDIVDAANGKVQEIPSLILGKESVFEVHWKISNLYNDVSGAVASLSIPSGVMWKDLAQTHENVSWNDRTQKLTWELGKLPGATGMLSPSREIVFSIAVTPEFHQSGSDIILFSNIEVLATDDFTQEKLRLFSQSFGGKANMRLTE